MKPSFLPSIYSLVFALCLSIASMPARSECQCLWEGSFSDVQAKTALVVSGTVLSGKGNSIDLHVDRLLRGNESLEDIRIWMKTGSYCRPDASEFEADSRWVMALYQIDEVEPGGFNPSTPNVSFGRAGDYWLSSCGGYWLEQSENLVSGNLIDAPRWVREPKMTPVLIDLIADYVQGSIDANTLKLATQEDPALKELMLDTRAFLRSED